LLERFLSEIKIIETKYQTSLICDQWTLTLYF
jgi:hypothetical protein